MLYKDKLPDEAVNDHYQIQPRIDKKCLEEAYSRDSFDTIRRKVLTLFRMTFQNNDSTWGGGKSRILSPKCTQENQKMRCTEVHLTRTL